MVVLLLAVLLVAIALNKLSKLMKKYFLSTVLTLYLVSFSAQADHSAHRPDSHAPIGVMRDHIHAKGETMVSYRYKFMHMGGGMLDGSSKVSNSDVLKEYQMTPSDMDMRMNMFGAMHGITDNLTIYAMSGIMEKKMHMVNRSDQTLTRESVGIADTKVGAMYEFFNNGKNRLQYNLGVSIPTGDIDQGYKGTRLAYSMQNGSGSYDILPGLSYAGFKDSYSYGAQTNAVLRTHNNKVGYQSGHVYNFTTWAAKKLNNAFSVSSRLDYTITGATKGSDPSLALGMSPANNARFSGGKELDLLLGVNFMVSSGALKGHRFALEGGVPLYQRFRGTQLSNQYMITLGWQKIF